MARFTHLGLVLAVLIFAGAAPAAASFSMCNHTSFNLNAAIAVPKAQDWNVTGWYSLRPGECREVIRRLPKIRSLYVYAESDRVHEGAVRRFEGERDFCVDTNSFNYTSTRSCPPTGGQTRTFARVEISEDAKTWTHRFRETSGIPYTLRRARYAGLQRLLKEDGRFKRRIDALMGRHTRRAIGKAKKDYRLPEGPFEADGLYDALLVKRRQKNAEIGLKFCNDSPYEIWSAIAYGPDGDWVSRGWWAIKPQSCIPIVKDELPDRFIYYYAEAETEEGWRVSWQGEHPFCIADIKFNIEDTARCEERGYHQARFRRIDTDEHTGWELTFREEDATMIPKGILR